MKETQIKFKQLLVPAFGMLLWKKGIYFFQRSVSEGKNLQQLDCTNERWTGPLVPTE